MVFLDPGPTLYQWAGCFLCPSSFEPSVVLAPKLCNSGFHNVWKMNTAMFNITIKPLIVVRCLQVGQSIIHWVLWCCSNSPNSCWSRLGDRNGRPYSILKSRSYSKIGKHMSEKKKKNRYLLWNCPAWSPLAPTPRVVSFQYFQLCHNLKKDSC